MVFLAEFYKLPQVFSAGKIKHALLFFMMDPENICGNDVNAAHFHLNDLILPAAVFTTGKFTLILHQTDRRYNNKNV